MRPNYSPAESIGLREWVMGNGKILKESVRQFYRFNGGAVLRAVQPHIAKLQYGPSPFTFDWDACIVLDACRPDALQEVAGGYDWLPDDIGRVRSAASHSRGWYRKALDPERWSDELAKTAMVTWNPHSDIYHTADDWALFDEVWQDGWDDDRGLVRPSVVTEHAIAAGREADADRLMVHYQQPHDPYPSIEVEVLETGDLDMQADTQRWSAWQRCIDADDPLTTDDVWDGMIENLHWVLGEIETLLENLDAERVLLTADHGECFGTLGIYGHAEGVPLPSLVYVPQVWLSATDERTVRLDVGLRETTPDADVDERLEALGYR